MSGNKTVDLRLERQLRRIWKPDGQCYQCGLRADRHHPVGPIVVRISEPDSGDEFYTHEFCNWECLGHWAAVQAGWESYRPPLDA